MTKSHVAGVVAGAAGDNAGAAPGPPPYDVGGAAVAR